MIEIVDLQEKHSKYAGEFWHCSESPQDIPNDSQRYVLLTYWIWRSELEAGLFRCTMEPWPRWIHVFKTPFWQPVLSFWLEWRQNHYLSELLFPSIATINVSFQTWQTSYQALKRRQSKTVQRRDPRLPPAMTPALGGSNTQCSCWAHVLFLK